MARKITRWLTTPAMRAEGAASRRAAKLAVTLMHTGEDDAS